MIEGRWYVQLAAIWHWYLPSWVYVVLRYMCVYIYITVSAHFKKIKKIFRLVLIN